jgi:hypothetical protein
MRMLKVLLALTTTVALFAQTPVRPRAAARQAGAAQDAPAGPAQNALKTALGLSDQQISQLIQLRKDERQALQPVRQQMQDTAKALRDASAAANPDPTAVGKLTLQLRGLREQVLQTNKTYHNQALALLDDTQKTKLENIQQSLQRLARAQAAIRAATALNLLEPPARGKAVQGAGAGAGVRARMRQRLGAAQGPQ